MFLKLLKEVSEISSKEALKHIYFINNKKMKLTTIRFFLLCSIPMLVMFFFWIYIGYILIYILITDSHNINFYELLIYLVLITLVFGGVVWNLVYFIKKIINFRRSDFHFVKDYDPSGDNFCLQNIVNECISNCELKIKYELILTSKNGCYPSIKYHPLKNRYYLYIPIGFYQLVFSQKNIAKAIIYHELGHIIQGDLSGRAYMVLVNKTVFRFFKLLYVKKDSKNSIYLDYTYLLRKISIALPSYMALFLSFHFLSKVDRFKKYMDNDLPDIYHVILMIILLYLSVKLFKRIRKYIIHKFETDLENYSFNSELLADLHSCIYSDSDTILQAFEFMNYENYQLKKRVQLLVKIPKFRISK